MKDGNFPPSLWGELIFTAAYLSNRSPHSALGGATPYFRMQNKEADLSGLRTIEARAFVHRQTYTRKLDDRAFEGKLWGFSQDSRAYRIYNPAKVTVVESRNVTFLETPAYSLPLGVTSEDYHYEGEVFRFTSALDRPLMAEDTFDEEGFCSSMEQEARMQRPATGGTETQQDERPLPRASHITSTPLCLSWGRIGQLWGRVTKHRARHNGRT